MSYVNYDDIANQLRGAGLVLGSVTKSNGGVAVGELYIASTKSVRCDIEGEGKKKSGAYLLHELRLDDGVFITGSYWLDHGNTSYKLELNKVCAGCGADVPLKGADCPACGGKKYKVREIPKEQLEAHKKRMAEARRQAEVEAKADAERAAAWASAVWLKCREITSPDEHDYLARKKLKQAYGTRILDNHDGVMLEGAEKSDYEYLAKFHGALVVPLLDKDGRRCGLQFILSREKHKDLITKMGRDKQGWPKGMISQGKHYLIGGQPQGVCLVTEGFATGASLHEATNLPVAVAFAANNLLPVGETIWKQSRKRARLLYCADDDWVQRCDTKTGGCGKYTPAASHLCKHCGHPHGKKNVGIEYSQSAALATSGAWLAPVFSAQRPDDRKGDTDFNDLRCAEGEQAVGGQIATKLEEMGWVTPARALFAPRAGLPIEGGGESIARTTLKSMLTIDEAAERFALVYGGKSTIFDYQEHILVPKADVLDILPEHGWRDLRSIKKVVRMEEVGFDPACTDKRILCNLWGGWPTVPKQGHCESLIELLEYLCSEEENYRVVFEWVIKWIAYPIQHPGAKMRTALIFHGPQGTGKNLFFEAVMAIYGEYGRIVDQAAIEDKFNSWASRKLLMLADEVVARQELYHVKNKLKSFVTGEWIRINPKNVAAHDERNHVNLVFMSNESQPLVLEKDDRRYTVIHTPEKLPPEFYQQVRDELNNGGIAALHHYLLNIDLDDFDEHTKPPMTTAKENLIEVSLDSVQRFIGEWHAGQIDDAPFCPCLGRHLFITYRKWCDAVVEKSPRSEAQFIGVIRNFPRWRAGKPISTQERIGSSKIIDRRMVIPPAEMITSSKYFKELDATNKEDIANSSSRMTQQVWLTGCFFTFANAGEFKV